MSNSSSSFNTFLENDLNPVQKNAVTHLDSPLLVIAGAGSGKTRVITARIAHLLINKNAAPSSIVALTFTNKAAKEMKERVKNFLPPESSLPFVGTFHSYCLQLLKKNNQYLRTPFTTIIDTDDQQKIIQTLLKTSNAKKLFTPKQLLYRFSHIKNNQGKEPIEKLFEQEQTLVKELYYAYEKEKEISNCLDFDDLLLKAVDLFKNEEFIASFHTKVHHILIDEYQDTNHIQHTLLKKMAQRKITTEKTSLCVVGDEDQSIYSWRGATVANITHFRNDFPETQTIKIEQNYRSAQPILSAANALISNNEIRNPKKLWSTKKGLDRVRTIQCNSEYQEADVIIQLLKTSTLVEKTPSIAILYRTHMQSRALEEACIKNNIVYKMVGSTQFYERKEIKDVLAYLRLLVNPFDRTAFFRVINCPARGLGPAFETLVQNFWKQEPFLTFTEVLLKLIESDVIKGVKKESVEQFLRCFKNVSIKDTPAHTLAQLLIDTQYITYLKNSCERKEAESRIANVHELVNAVQHMESEGTVQTIEQLLDEISLMQEKNTDANAKDPHIVTLMTLHAAKGLEFDWIILAGLEDGILPSTRSLLQNSALEEERRLFYVGITRARERVLITHSKYRYTYGQMIDQIPSRFLKEIPEKFLSAYDVSNKKSCNLFFKSWLGLSSSFDAAEPTNIMTFQSKSIATNSQFKLSPQSKFNKKFSFESKKEQTNPVTKKSVLPAHTTYKKHQAVRHQKYGIGVIQSVEAQSNTKIFVTVQFKCGKKKIIDRFLQKI